MSLAQARAHARVGRLAEMRAVCTAHVEEHPMDVVSLLEIGDLLSRFGFVSDARACFERAQVLAPTDLRAAINLANLAHEAGDHEKARHLYARLLQSLPDHPITRRNALTSLAQIKKDTHFNCPNKQHPLN